MLSELASPHIRCCLSATPSDLMKSTVVDESLSSMNQQFCSRESQLLQTPILHLPNSTGRFHLYSDTSKFAMGSALYQIQNGKPKLIAYTNKRLLEAARNYSITELELCGLAINIVSFPHLLKRVDFDMIVDHLALTHILKAK